MSTGIHNENKDGKTSLDGIANSSSTLPQLFNQNNRLNARFSGNLLKQSKTGYLHGVGMNIYIVYKLQKRTVNNPDFAVQNALFGAIKITKNVNTSHHKYIGYRICLDSNSSCFGNSVSAKKCNNFWL